MTDHNTLRNSRGDDYDKEDFDRMWGTAGKNSCLPDRGLLAHSHWVN